MKFTPGPWHIEEKSLHAAPVVKSQDREIAQVRYHMGSEDGEVFPNAHLIAAAPDIYDALQNVIDQFGYALPKRHVELYEAILKKARGE